MRKILHKITVFFNIWKKLQEKGAHANDEIIKLI